MASDIVLTKEGLQEVKEELEHLKSVHRKEVADRLRNSKQFGEFLENSEYEEAKTEQAFVEGRILELQRILQHAVVIDESQIPRGRVGIGSRVKLRDLASGEEFEYRIVGPVEADPANGMISNESPVGRALLDRKPGERVKVDTPAGSWEYLVVSLAS